ncbi:unnamed protein product, partial [marine sediment metagenome]
DGGSKDNTIEILRQYPRTNIQIRTDIKTTGKGMEILLKKATTEWIVFVDNAKVPDPGWYDEMCKSKHKYDFFGSKRIVHYEFEREDTTTTDWGKRPLGGLWMIKKSLVEDIHVDDDYMWRVVDLWLRQGLEEVGIDKDTGRIWVEVSKKYFRPIDVNFLLGDASKARKILDWKPTVTFDELVEIMVVNEK